MFNLLALRDQLSWHLEHDVFVAKTANRQLVERILSSNRFER